MAPAQAPAQATALVIDDNKEMADSLCQMLEMLGLKAYPAYGPRGAMLALNQITPQVVLLDVNMPGVDGFEVMAYLRRMPALAEVPVVFVTSDDQAETQAKARQTGALLVLIKPPSLAAIEAILHKAKLV